MESNKTFTFNDTLNNTLDKTENNPKRELSDLGILI